MYIMCSYLIYQAQRLFTPEQFYKGHALINLSSRHTTRQNLLQIFNQFVKFSKLKHCCIFQSSILNTLTYIVQYLNFAIQSHFKTFKLSEQAMPLKAKFVHCSFYCIRATTYLFLSLSSGCSTTVFALLFPFER